MSVLNPPARRKETIAMKHLLRHTLFTPVAHGHHHGQIRNCASPRASPTYSREDPASLALASDRPCGLPIRSCVELVGDDCPDAKPFFRSGLVVIVWSQMVRRAPALDYNVCLTHYSRTQPACPRTPQRLSVS